MDSIEVDYSHMDDAEYKENVYYPEEDTFVFVNALDRDVDHLCSRAVSLALEIGCGSGYISTYLLKLLRKNQLQGTKTGIDDYNNNNNNDNTFGSTSKVIQEDTLHESDIPFVLAVDINRFANLATLTTAQKNGTDTNLDTVTMDMFTALSKRQTKGMFDLIMFNPPYIPSSNVDAATGCVDLSWKGGAKGREVTDRFIRSVGGYLSQDGTVYLMVEKKNDVSDVLDMITRYGFQATIIYFRQILGEKLYVIRFTRH